MTMSQTTSPSPLTVVFVHGAFADSSSWTGVLERLQANNVQVVAAANPLRGISIDSAYVASVFHQIQGPVLAVGHSYGGAVISNAATGARNIVGLVFVAAFAPDEGERLGEVTGTSKDSVLNSALVPHQYPTGNGTATEFSIDPAKARDAFAALSDAAAGPLLDASTVEAPLDAAWTGVAPRTVVATEVTVPKKVCSGKDLAFNATFCPTLISAMSFSETGV